MQSADKLEQSCHPCGGLGVLGLVPVAILIQIPIALWAVWIVIAALLNMR